jgi:glyoxylase-like metal-dependent hydrolase (beta-lactamase superfamily II)
MERLTIETGSFGVNTSIITCENRTWIVDPGGDAECIVELLKKKGLSPEGIMLTHAHFDHIGAVNALQAEFKDLIVVVDEADLVMFGHPMNQMPPDYPPVEMPSCLLDSCPIKDCEVIETPGHTPGGVSFYFPNEKLLLAGDTLFAGSVGRTDLPGGDMATLMGSIQKLKALPDDTIVIPGHGRATTIGDEKKSNPFMV